MHHLFEPYDLAGLTLANRIVMAPMTRSRAISGIADEHTALYYAQRASAGLIVSEGSQVSLEGQGYLFTPGIYTDEQVEGWRKTTNAVHAAGGKIFIQLWHVGRMSHTTIQQHGAAPVSSVDRQAKNSTAYAYDAKGRPAQVPASKPRALTVAEIHRITHDFVVASKNAIDAGFDGVELHAANGYLFEQFINGGLNNRDDTYGGPNIENRLRFLLETLDAMSAAIGRARVGVRVSPQGRLFDMHEFEGEEQTWFRVAEELTHRKLAYVHVSDMGITQEFLRKFRVAYSGTLILAGSYTGPRGEQAIAQGLSDLIAYGRPFISNPDLVNRLKQGWPLTPADPAVFYGGDLRGYTGYLPYSGH